MKIALRKFQHQVLEGLWGKIFKILHPLKQKKQFTKKSDVISPYPLFKDVIMEAMEVGFVVMTNCRWHWSPFHYNHMHMSGHFITVELLKFYCASSSDQPLSTIWKRAYWMFLSWADTLNYSTAVHNLWVTMKLIDGFWSISSMRCIRGL